MKRISRWKVGVGAVVLVAVIAGVGAKVIASPTDSYLAYRKKAVDAVTAARMEDQADLDKKYTGEVNTRLVKLVGAVKAKGFPGKAGSTVDTLYIDNGMTPGPDGLLLKSNDGKVNLVVTTVPLLKAWVTTADAGIKSADDVAAIFDNETFYTDVLGGDAAEFRFAELPVKRKPADAVVKALLLGDSQDGMPDGPNTLMVSVRQGARVYILWRDATLPTIVACSAEHVAEEQRSACFAQQLPKQRRYSRFVSDAQAMVDAVVQ
ncbi:TPA: hypothetical protein QDC20_007167 [Burkholderia aenigmatica]|uniref:hypothetical protein n=1 Tax=Burkholderia sp. AU45251 TaxID=3059204 RepID=UPI002656D3C7|nr:hypothetical protein [Burkholderia sp. AU45251]HDR9486837.1 hypothetical protein [Burkholderia aenigmatica]MDN7519690.1 hypothetical protein [Burkholderia sp. AU45251]HDR9518627.1 hypothetical protein [Burkholderia aenigmatica]HDR9595494.1 hypothetical protein [Burkholderia aenigmatica]HDR9602471.1 hypothetical protein [Burkholderia aenigmatica]